jgi:hypothetical protein
MMLVTAPTVTSGCSLTWYTPYSVLSPLESMRAPLVWLSSFSTALFWPTFWFTLSVDQSGTLQAAVPNASGDRRHGSENSSA